MLIMPVNESNDSSHRIKGHKKIIVGHMRYRENTGDGKKNHHTDNRKCIAFYSVFRELPDTEKNA